MASGRIAGTAYAARSACRGVLARWPIASSRRWSLGADLARLKGQLARVYAEALLGGRWFSDLREALAAFTRVIAAARHRHRSASAAERTMRGGGPALGNAVGRPAAGPAAGQTAEGRWRDGAPVVRPLRRGSRQRRSSISAHRSAFDRRLFEDDVTGSLAWAEGAGAGRRADARRMRIAIRAALEELLSQAGDPSFFDSADGCRATRTSTRSSSASCRAGRRRRPPAAHRPLAQRAGGGRPAAVSETPRPGCCSAR